VHVAVTSTPARSYALTGRDTNVDDVSVVKGKVVVQDRLAEPELEVLVRLCESRKALELWRMRQWREAPKPYSAMTWVQGVPQCVRRARAVEAVLVPS